MKTHAPGPGSKTLCGRYITAVRLAVTMPPTCSLCARFLASGGTLTRRVAHMGAATVVMGPLTDAQKQELFEALQDSAPGPTEWARDQMAGMDEVEMAEEYRTIFLEDED